MPRVHQAACVLILVGGLVAGCGGMSATQVAAQVAAHQFGEANARVVSVDQIRNMAGTEEALVTMRGHFKDGSSVVPYVVVEVPHGWTTSPGYSVPPPSEVVALARAKAASPLFKIFPDFDPGAVRCTIPRAGSSTMPGGCQTIFKTIKGRTRVEFVEHWQRRHKVLYSGQPIYKLTCRWIVTLGAHGGVESIYVAGHNPPQLSK